MLASLKWNKRQNSKPDEVSVWHLKPIAVYQTLNIYHYQWEILVSLELSRGEVLLNSNYCWSYVRSVHASHITEHVHIFWVTENMASLSQLFLYGVGRTRAKRVGQGRGREQGRYLVPFLFQDYQQRAALLLGWQCKTNAASAGLQARLGQLGSAQCPHWDWPSGAPSFWLPSFTQADGNAAITYPLQSWSIFQPCLLLPSALGTAVTFSVSRMSKTHPGLSLPFPKRGHPPPLYVCIHTRAHTALPPSGLQTAKGVSKQTCFRVFFPQMLLIWYQNFLQAHTRLCLPNLEVPGSAHTHGRAVSVCQQCGRNWEYHCLSIGFR